MDSHTDKLDASHDGQYSRSLSFTGLRHMSLKSSSFGSDMPQEVRGPLGLNLLHEPSDPRVDFIFVHGLEGGSHKTWNISTEPSQFWPKAWLPHEEGFEHVRIYSYGYKSQCSKDSPDVDTNEFGRALLRDIGFLSPKRNAPNAPIVFIAHSMGGLLVKKAYLVAKHGSSREGVFERIRSLIFLGTPHRGADSAQFLKRLSSLPGMPTRRGFLSNLVSSSRVLLDINESFRQESQGVAIYSFYETLKTNLGFAREIIVSWDSAILGLESECVRFLGTDHRHLCKFQDQSDADYKSLREAMLDSLRQIEEDSKPSAQAPHSSKHDVRQISEFLSISTHHTDEVLHDVTDVITEGSCEWILKRPAFRAWVDISGVNSKLESEGAFETTPPRIFWLSGQPGTGKTTISGHVIQYAKKNNLDCSFHFFKSGDKTGFSLSYLLRSIALQMARSNPEIQQALLDLIPDSECINLHSYQSVWRSIFLSRIFQIPFSKPHYWVIDALDECDDSLMLIRLLSRLDKSLPLKIFITSRFMPSVERLLAQQKMPVFAETMSLEDSLGDIERYLEDQAPLLPIESESKRRHLVRQILAKSSGCFLWATLVFRHLQEAYSWSATQEILDEVPLEMNELYEKTLSESIAAMPRNRVLAKAIFRWVICAIRPLTVDELKGGLHFDIEMSPLVESSIQQLCGHLVYVDKSSLVQILHQTVIPFLTDQCPVAEFAIDKKKAQARIALACLTFLSEESFRRSRPRPEDISGSPSYLLPFSTYAATHFSDHLSKTSSQSDELFDALTNFLGSPNVLSWIECLAQSGSLYTLTLTAKNLKAYLLRRAKYSPPLGNEIRLIESWIQDFIHIGALFAQHLLVVPKAIHFLVPSLCPQNSAIFKQFGNRTGILKVMGKPDTEWDDRLTTFFYPDSKAKVLACGATHFAVGIGDGRRIMLYNSATFEHAGSLEHPGSVTRLAFANVHPFLVSCSLRKLILWNLQTKSRIWSVNRLASQSIDVRFESDDSRILVATYNGASTFDISDGHETRCLDYFNAEDDNVPPFAAKFSPGLDSLAVLRRDKPPAIWDISRKCIELEIVRKGYETTFQVPYPRAVVFHPNPEIRLFGMAYNDGLLVVHDLRSNQQLATFPLLAQTLAVSPDGRTLATGDSEGRIHLFNFETLRLSYCISSDAYGIESIAFVPSSFRFVDIRSEQCNVWGPAVLVTEESSDDTSTEPVSEEVPSAAQYKISAVYDDRRFISAIIEHHDQKHIFCGRSDGSLAVYETKTSNLAEELHRSTAFTEVRLLDWNASRSILTSADALRYVTCRKVTQGTAGDWHATKPLFNWNFKRSIIQILTNQQGDRLFVSTESMDIVLGLDDHGHGHEINHYSDNEKRHWISHPTDPEHLILFKNGRAFLYDWTEFQLITKNGVLLEPWLETDLSVSQMTTCRQTNTIGAFLTKQDNDNNGRKNQLAFWSAAHLATGTAKPPTAFKYCANGIKAIIGVDNTSLLFLDPEGWVCSLSLNRGSNEVHVRHFFIPSTWYRNGRLVCYIIAGGSVVFAVKDKPVIFIGGLKFKIPQVLQS